MVNASARGRSNQRKGGVHERKIAKALGELTGFAFERNLEQRRFADHLGDLVCTDAKFPFAIENKYRSKGNGIPAGAWDQARRTATKTKQWPCVIFQNGRTAPRCRVPLASIGAAPKAGSPRYLNGAYIPWRENLTNRWRSLNITGLSRSVRESLDGGILFIAIARFGGSVCVGNKVFNHNACRSAPSSPWCL